MKTVKYDIYMPSELAAGLRGFDDTVTITVDSGDPGRGEGEFEEFMRLALAEWYDGAMVRIVKE